MKRPLLVVLAVLSVAYLGGCATTPVAPRRADAGNYEYVAQILAMPSRRASVTEIAPCYAAFRTDAGETFIIGSPASPPEVAGFLETLEKGKAYFLPEAFMEYQTKGK